MKNLCEIIDPIKDFYSMRYKNMIEVCVYIFLPVCTGSIFLIMTFLTSTVRKFAIDIFIIDLLNQLITMLTLFISFSMAYLSMIITSGSDNVNNLKATPSEKYCIKRTNEFCTLYQVIVCEITYTLVFNIFFLLIVFFEKFLVYIINEMAIKFIIAINISLLAHILLIMLITVKDIYYSFWKSE